MTLEGIRTTNGILEMTSRRFLSSSEIDYIRVNYDGTNAQELSKRFGVKLSAIKYQIYKAGLAPLRHRWTKDEEELLSEYIGRYSIGEIAHKLKRSKNSIAVKAKRLHYSRARYQSYNKQDIYEMLGVHYL